ncbi:Uncharacterized protein FKW44_010783, partial [Caligus rogercresseyi]
AFISIGGIAIMYKIQILGPQNVLHKYEPFLLNGPICILLYVLGSIILSMSSSVLYMYGTKSSALSSSPNGEAPLLTLVLFPPLLSNVHPHRPVVCNGPLLYDYTLIYKGSLDGTVLYTVIAVISHLFLWILTWLFLTVKQGWRFKLRVTAARSIKLVNDVELDSDAENGPMLIVGYGKHLP